MRRMSEQSFQKYFESIKDTKEFAEIDKVIRFSNYTSPDSLYGKLCRYISYFHTRF